MNQIKEKLLENLIVKFVKENQRSPSKAEMLLLKRSIEEEYKETEEIGSSAYFLSRPGFQDNSSIDIENTNRLHLLSDAIAINNKLLDIQQTLDESFKKFQSYSLKMSKDLSRLEDKVNTVILNQSKADIFIHSIQEDFSLHDKINFSESTALVENGYVTLSRDELGKINLENSEVKFNVLAPKGYLSNTVMGDTASLTKEDGNFLQYMIWTNYYSGTVSLAISINLPDITSISNIKLNGNPINTNSNTSINTYTADDTGIFTLVEPANLSFDTPEIVIPIDRHKIKSIRIILTKMVADDFIDNKYVFLFSLDNLSIYSTQYTSSVTNNLVAGPYQVLDHTGKAINFSKAKLSECSILPKNTTISFLISKDGSNWKRVSNIKDEIITFGSNQKGLSPILIDNTNPAGNLEVGFSDVKDIDYATEAVLNEYIGYLYADKVPLSSIEVKRNVLYDDAPATILENPPGWTFSNNKRSYSTIVEVDKEEGILLDFGPNSLFLNQKEVNGLVRIPYGRSTVEISDSNWYELTPELSDISALKNTDPLYPYNHKYLIQGYAYASNFSGEKIYIGTDRIYAKYLKYINPDVFAFLDEKDVDYYNSFTIINTEVGLFIKVKINKRDTSWSSERYETFWTTQTLDTNTIYLKAILASSSSTASPILKSFTIRVI